MRLNIIKLEKELASQHLTRTQLSERSGISRQSISTILKRGTCMTQNAGKIAEALGVDIDEIIKQEG